MQADTSPLPEEEFEMATQVDVLTNFIDGERVPATGDTEAILNPATGEELARAPVSTAEDVDRAVRAARRAFEGWSQTTPAQRAQALLALARPDRGARRGDRAPGGAERRQADRGRQERRDPGDGRQPALLRRRRALPGGPGGRRVHGGLHLVHAPRGGRRDRPDHALELPADDGDLEDRPGARGRQHDRAEARRDDADHDREAGRAGRRDPAEGRPQRRHRPRPARPGRR